MESKNALQKGELFKKLQKSASERMAKLKQSLTPILREAGERIGAEHVERCAIGLLRGVLAFLFTGTRMAMGTYPLGFSLLLASGKDSPFVYIGCLVASLFNTSLTLPLFLIATLIIGCRILLGWLRHGRAGIFAESLMARMLIGSFAGFLMGLWVLVSGGFLFYDLFGAIFLTVFTPIATFLFACADKDFSGELPGRMLFGEAGAAALLFALVLSLKPLTILGFDTAAIAALFITLTVAKSSGVLRGCVLGLVLGAAYHPLSAPAFAAAGLASGALMKLSPPLACVAALASASAYIAYISGGDALNAILPDLLASAILFIPLAKFGALPRMKFFAEQGIMSSSSARSAMIAKRANEGMRQDVEALSASLAQLSEVFSSLSERMRKPQYAELKRECDAICSRYCDDCRLSTLCWDEEYTSTVDFINKLSEMLNKQGRVCENELPIYMVERCPDITAICAELNHLHARLLEEALQKDKTGLMAEDMQALSKLLCEKLQTGEREFEIDEVLTRKCSEAFGYLGFYASNTAVFGSRQKFIISGGVDLARMHATAKELVACVESVCGMRFSHPQFAIDGDYITMTMQSRASLAAEYARAGVTRQSESVNGDTVNIFEGRDDRLYALLSDGMGSGRDAALTSRITSVVMEKLLMGGAGRTASVSVLNSTLRNKGIECFATVDLLEVDLLSGEASFTKCGAAPSYILRDGSLFKISSDSLPVGITAEIDCEEVRFTLEAGDVVIMMSDGVVSSEEDAAWLCELLTYGWEENLNRMAEKILREAKMRRGGDLSRCDDMTLGLNKLRAAKGLSASDSHTGAA